ncbi:hypothetical protein, partial [Promicromonospora kroppenstedtii]|uniref:hypothetical protein n=1 Tax=Promicromonospora kroppenstedtii TaxID=440482 RepID=UPI001B7FEC07
MTDHAYTRISFDSRVSGSIAKQRARLARHSPDAVVYEERSVSGAKVPFADRGRRGAPAPRRPPARRPRARDEDRPRRSQRPRP